MSKIPLLLSAILLGILLGKPVFAQVDFSGEWAPLYHKDGRAASLIGSSV